MMRKIKQINFGRYRNIKTRELEPGIYRSKESLLLDKIYGLKMSESIQLSRFRDVREIRSLAQVINMYLSRCNNEELSKKFMQEIDDLNLTYTVKRLKNNGIHKKV